MDTPQSIKQVAEFHRTFKHPIQEEPVIPDQDRCALRVALLAEELEELKTAILKKDIVEVADALCDLQYVLAGAVLEFGLGGKFRELFEEVHRSNMSKACRTEAEAEATVRFFQEKENVESYFRESDGHFLVYRKSDNKTMKSVMYSPARLEGIMGNQVNSR
jgi:predicted HAD superfamily Cof-like phosphohydrolase